MKRICRRYVFNSKEQYQDKIREFKDSEFEGYTPNSHFFVSRGHEVLEPQETDENGEITKEAVLSDKYLADVAWIQKELEFEDNVYKCPYGWATYRVVPSNPTYVLRGMEEFYDNN